MGRKRIKVGGRELGGRRERGGRGGEEEGGRGNYGERERMKAKMSLGIVNNKMNIWKSGSTPE